MLPSWLEFLPLTEPLRYFDGRKELHKLEASGKLFTVLTSRDLKAVPKNYVNYFASLYHMFDPSNPHLYLSHEMHATPGGITYRLWAPNELTDFTQKLTQAIDIAAELHPVEPAKDPLRLDRYKYRQISGAELHLSEHFMFPLLQSRGDKFQTDAMTTLCAALSHLKGDDEIVVQFMLRPVSAWTVKLARMKYDNYERFGSRPMRSDGALLRGLSAWTRSTLLPLHAVYQGVLAPIGANLAKLKPKEDKDALEKVNEGQFFDCFVRILSSAKDVLRARENLTTALSSFAPMQAKNRWKAERKANLPSRYRIPFTSAYLFPRDGASQLLKNMVMRRIPVFDGEDYLGPAELASVVHYADASIPFVKRIISKKLPVPEGVLTYPSIKAAWGDKAVVIGFSDYRGEKKYIAVRDPVLFSRHFYIIGTTGSGKTTWLQFVAAQVVQLWGWGLVYYDVKGDAVDKLMQYVPDDDSLLYMDFSNQIDPEKAAKLDKKFAQYYIPFNMLRFPEMTDYQLAEMLVGVFVRVFGSQNIMYKSQNYLRKAILAVVATDPRGTILEVYRMFTDADYLDLGIERLEKNGKFPDVLSFWKNVYREMTPKTRYGETQAIQNKLELITQNEKPLYTLCQTENVLQWRRILDTRKRVLVNLAQGSNSDEIQRFFGTLITAFIKRAAWSREDTKEENRPPVLFVLDEFEKFAGNAADIEEMLALARSYGICLLMAHQDADQIEGKLLNQVLGLTSTNICLNIGEPSAARLHHSFPGLDKDDLTGLVAHQAACRMKFQSNQTFTFSTIPLETMELLNREIQKTKRKQYAKHYRHLSAIEPEIRSRYMLVEKNQETESAAHVKKGRARGKLTAKGKGGPNGKIS